jgi:hypothetical protein
VVEPPHRPDRQTIPTHRRIARMLALQDLDSESLIAFMGEFDELLQRYEDRLASPAISPITPAWPPLNTPETAQ